MPQCPRTARAKVSRKTGAATGGTSSRQGSSVGGELINKLGDKGVRQSSARTRRTLVAAPFVSAGKAPQIGERNDFVKLVIQGAQPAQFSREHGEKLALQMVENRREVSQESYGTAHVFSFN